MLSLCGVFRVGYGIEICASSRWEINLDSQTAFVREIDFECSKKNRGRAGVLNFGYYFEIFMDY